MSDVNQITNDMATLKLQPDPERRNVRPEQRGRDFTLAPSNVGVGSDPEQVAMPEARTAVSSEVEETENIAGAVPHRGQVTFSIREFPKCQGRGIEKFFQEVDFLLNMHEVTDKLRTQLLPILLYGEAEAWYQAIGRQLQPQTYQALKDGLLRTFSDKRSARTTVEQFFQLKQHRGTRPTSFVLKALREAETIRTRFTEQEIVFHIVDRMLPEIRGFINSRYPRTTVDLFDYVQEFEEAFQSAPSPNYYPDQQHWQQYREPQHPTRYGNQNRRGDRRQDNFYRYRHDRDDRNFNTGYEYRREPPRQERRQQRAEEPAPPQNDTSPHLN